MRIGFGGVEPFGAKAGSVFVFERAVFARSHRSAQASQATGLVAFSFAPNPFYGAKKSPFRRVMPHRAGLSNHKERPSQRRPFFPRGIRSIRETKNALSFAGMLERFSPNGPWASDDHPLARFDDVRRGLTQGFQSVQLRLQRLKLQKLQPPAARSPKLPNEPQ